MIQVSREEAALLEALPISKWFNDFEFRRDGRAVGELQSRRLWRRRALVIGGDRYHVGETGFTRREFVLARDRKVFARALQRTRDYEFALELDVGEFTLHYTSVEPCLFSVLKGDAQVGSLRRENPATRRTRIALPAYWPLLEQAFVFWVTVFIYERVAASRDL